MSTKGSSCHGFHGFQKKDPCLSGPSICTEEGLLLESRGVQGQGSGFRGVQLRGAKGVQGLGQVTREFTV